MTEAEHAYVAAVGTTGEWGAAVILFEKGYDADHVAHLRKVASQSPREFVDECEQAARRQRRGELGMAWPSAVVNDRDTL